MWLLGHLYGGVNASKTAIMGGFPEDRNQQMVKYSNEGNIFTRSCEETLESLVLDL